jgi:hypothetical protein
VLSLLPIALLLNISIPCRQKFLICTLMGLGILATCATFPKFKALRALGTDFDISWDGGKIAMWSVLESSLGMIAACLPPLKTAAEAWLRRMGLVSTQGSRIEDTEQTLTDSVGTGRTVTDSEGFEEMEMGLKR